MWPIMFGHLVHVSTRGTFPRYKEPLEKIAVFPPQGSIKLSYRNIYPCLGGSVIFSQELWGLWLAAVNIPNTKYSQCCISAAIFKNQGPQTTLLQHINIKSQKKAHDRLTGDEVHALLLYSCMQKWHVRKKKKNRCHFSYLSGLIYLIIMSQWKCKKERAEVKERARYRSTAD